MYLIIGSDNIIKGTCDQLPNLEDLGTRGERIVEIADQEFQSDMIGAIYVEN